MPKNWYWTPERLVQLVGILNEVADTDTQGYFFGNETRILTKTHEHPLFDKNLQDGNFTEAFSVLIFLKVVVPAKSTQTANYKHRIYSDRVSSITQEGVDRYRGSKTRR